MAAGDMSIVQGPYGVQTFEVASGATAINAGEPVEILNTNYSSGASGTNTVTVAADANPLIGTDDFVGIANKAGTHTASAAGNVEVATVVPHFTRVRAKAKTAASMDTAAELTNILFDVIAIDLTSSTYTFDQTAAANTSAWRIENGDIVRGTLDCTIDARAMRQAVA